MKTIEQLEAELRRLSDENYELKRRIEHQGFAKLTTQAGLMLRLTAETFAAHLHEVDPAARVVHINHDEITIHCTPDKVDLVRKLLEADLEALWKRNVL